MSTHCSRFPKCGCLKTIGTKCHLPEGDIRLMETEREPTDKDLIAFRKFMHGK